MRPHGREVLLGPSSLGKAGCRLGKSSGSHVEAQRSLTKASPGTTGCQTMSGCPLAAPSSHLSLDFLPDQETKITAPPS